MSISRIPQSERAIVKAIKKFLSGQPLLTHTTQEGIAIQLDKHKAFILDFDLHTVKAKLLQDPSICIGMTVMDAVFIRHLLSLRKDLLERMGLVSLNWKLLPSYYIELENGKKFSLPSLLTKYSSAARRDTITLSAGLWKFMWYFKVSFNLPYGQLSIYNDKDYKGMIASQFMYAGKVYDKGSVLSIKETDHVRI